jgi:hypothetical protein
VADVTSMDETELLMAIAVGKAAQDELTRRAARRESAKRDADLAAITMGAEYYVTFGWRPTQVRTIQPTTDFMVLCEILDASCAIPMGTKLPVHPNMLKVSP